MTPASVSAIAVAEILKAPSQLPKCAKYLLMAMFFLTASAATCLPQPQAYPIVTNEHVEYASIWDECDNLLRLTFEKGPVLLVGGSRHLFRKTTDTTYFFDPGAAVCIGLLIKDQKAEQLIREGGWGGNPFQIKVTRDRKIIVTEELQNISLKTFYPFIEQTLVCDTRNCVASKKKCILDLPGDIRQKLVQRSNEILPILSKAIANKSDPMDLTAELSNALALRAILGDREAEKLLRHPPVQLDGGWGEIWHARSSDLDTAKRLGCAK